MIWEKLGIVYCPNGNSFWDKSHAMIPTPILINKNLIRIFVTFCDEIGRGRPGYVDVSAGNPLEVVSVSPQPLLELGAPGTFDENGVVACSVVNLGNGKMLMYYVGFELGVNIRYRLLTGLAISDDYGETFTRKQLTPVLERSSDELYFRCGPHCVYEDGIYRLWYVAGNEWIDVNGKMMPKYDIRYLESMDGINWPTTGKVQISVEHDDEHGFGRPYILPNTGSGYSMFYSIRSKSLGGYRMGYAESSDGIEWLRMDQKINLQCTPNSFDSDAMMYAAPVVVGDKTYIFYNGNNFGRDGFAVAVRKG